MDGLPLAEFGIQELLETYGVALFNEPVTRQEAL